MSRPRRQCGTMGAHNRLLETYRGFRKKQSNLEHATAKRMVSRAAFRTGLATIPVVVHVVYNKASENISDAQIKSQIAVLNKDYRGTNGDKSKVPSVWSGLVSDARIQFALASKDPKGKATTGITKTKTTRTSFGTGDTVKSKSTGGENAWPANKYLNIWVCTLSGGLLGYAQFPGGTVKNRRCRHPEHGLWD